MKKHILIVDDDRSIRASLEKILSAAGYQVTVAADGESAKAEFAEADLLVLDLNLPGDDGWDILDFLSGKHPLLPVIVISGLADQLEERAIPGASAFLEKPVEVPLLLATIERLLKQTPEERAQELNRTTEHWEHSAPGAGNRAKVRHKLRRLGSAQ